MKKKLLFDKVYEMTFEETYEQVEQFIQKTVNSFHNVQTHVYERDDIFQTACMSLYKAYKTYDIETNIKFITYFSRVMNNEILMLNRKTSKDKEKVILESQTIIENQEGDTCSFFDLTSSDINIEKDFINKELVKEILKELKSHKYKDIILDVLKNGNQYKTAIKYNISQSYVSRIYNNFIKEQKHRQESKDKKDLLRKVNIKAKGDFIMPRLNEDQLKKYLLKNANENTAVSKLISSYCKKYNVPESTVFTALIKRMPVFYEKIKSMSKQNAINSKTKKVFNINHAKNYIEEKVINEKYSLNKALIEYSVISNISVSTVRNYLAKEDKEFLDKIKNISISNIPDQYKNIAIKKKNNIKVSAENNIMSTDIVNKNIFEHKEDKAKLITLQEDNFQTLVNSNDNELIALLKNLNSANVSFNGELFNYSISSSEIKIYDKENNLICKKVMNLKDIENLLSELEKVKLIAKKLF